MKMKEALDFIEGKDNDGFMVAFERKKGNALLMSDHFPDKHAGEPLIKTEEEAWELAAKFAEAMKGKVVNVYVIKSDFCPAHNYREKYIHNRVESQTFRDPCKMYAQDIYSKTYSKYVDMFL